MSLKKYLSQPLYGMLLLVFFFSAIFSKSLTFVYIDGDDAASLSYHLLERDSSLQLPYAPYQGMADAALSLLPAQEHLLRVSAFLVTALAAVVFVSLLLSLLYAWVPNSSQIPQWLIALALLLAMPEISYFGLVYAPTLIAMSLHLGAHLTLRKIDFGQPLTRQGVLRFIFSLLLFGLGVSFRWNTLVYGAVIFVDIFFLKRGKLQKLGRLWTVLWGILVFFASLLMISFSGYRISDLVAQFSTVQYVFSQAGTLSPGVVVSWKESFLHTALTLTPLLTPALLLFALLGILRLLRERSPLLWVVLFGFLGILPWVRSGVPKFIITVLPALSLCFVVGFQAFWHWQQKRSSLPLKLGVIFLFLFPWVVGVSVSRPDMAWGPDFELRAFDYDDVAETQISLVFKAGMAFPTPEGARPLYGHGYALLGGGWRSFTEQSSGARQQATERAVADEMPIVVTNWSPDFFLIELYRLGFVTHEALELRGDDSYFAERLFLDNAERQLRLYFHEVDAGDVETLLQELKKTFAGQKFVLAGYPSLMRALYERMPAALTPFGGEVALVDFSLLPEDIANKRVPSLPEDAADWQVLSFAAQDGYLANPGMGWQDDADANKRLRNLPETVAYADRDQVAWVFLNPEEGVYDWTRLDAQLDAATAQGKQFSFRVITMLGEEYGGHMLPAWVLEKGARLLSSGEPDYANCTYQKEWTRFVAALIERYDGNPDIAFLDISGYSDFNEWSWDNQTEWDEVWQETYGAGISDPAAFHTLDGQARRRLADVFIGGAFSAHQCRTAEGGILTLAYDYPGFQQTQLIMPYAGIVQSSQYVASRRADVGFRHDCLGRSGTLDILDDLGGELARLWRQAPVVYELCDPKDVQIPLVRQMLTATHASIVHNNASMFSVSTIQALIQPLGYHYHLVEAALPEYVVRGDELPLILTWQNLGTAPNYPAMGQDFALHLYLVDEEDRITLDFILPVDTSAWLPADAFSVQPAYTLEAKLPLPADFHTGTYAIKVALIEKRTNNPIQLACAEENRDGEKCFVTHVTVTK